MHIHDELKEIEYHINSIKRRISEIKGQPYDGEVIISDHRVDDYERPPVPIYPYGKRMIKL